MQVTRGRMLTALGLLAATAIVLGRFNVGSPNILPRCLDRGLIAVELAESATELKMLWDQPADWRKNLRSNLKADFAFMGAYAFSFVLLGFLARQRNTGLLRLMGTIAIVTGIAAACFDVAENILTLKSIDLLERNNMPTDESVNATRIASFAKWSATGITLLLLFGAFHPSRRGEALYRVLAWMSTLLVVVAGVLAIWGNWDNPKIERVIPCLAAGLLPFVIIVWRFWTVQWWSEGAD